MNPPHEIDPFLYKNYFINVFLLLLKKKEQIEITIWESYKVNYWNYGLSYSQSIIIIIDNETLNISTIIWYCLDFQDFVFYFT